MRFKIFKKKFTKISGIKHIKMKDGKVFEAKGYLATLAGPFGPNHPICTAMTLTNGESRQEIDPFEIEEVF